MKPVFVFLVPFAVALAQGPPPQNPPGPLKAPAAAGQPAGPATLQVVAPPITPTGPSIHLTLQDALQRARQYSQQVYSSQFAAQLAHEDAVQAKAALLPTAGDFTQYIYTQPNGTSSGVFVANDGPHVYNQQALLHADIYNPGKLADYHRLLAAEAVARAKSDLAARGLFATVTQNYYSTVVGQRKIANAQASLTEAQQFLEITRKQEAGGEAAHADVVKAQIQVQQRERDLQDAAAAYEKSRIGLSVLIFSNYGQAYTLVDDLDTITELPPFPDLQTRATTNSPDLRVAEATVNQQNYALTSAKSGYLPSVSFDYFYGLDANTFAIHNRFGQNQLGSVAQATMTIPIWNWGATRSKVKQAEIGVQQAKADLSLAQRTLMSELDSNYLEAQVASAQLASLKSTQDLSVENLRLTRLRYTAGEATAQEVVDAQAQLVTARNAYDDGLVRYRIAIANLQTLTGAF